MNYLLYLDSGNKVLTPVITLSGDTIDVIDPRKNLYEVVEGVKNLSDPDSEASRTLKNVKNGPYINPQVANNIIEILRNSSFGPIGSFYNRIDW